LLYQIENDFVDVVRELPYRDLLTVRASSAEALAGFTGMTMGEVLQVPHHIYKYILHIPKPVLEVKLNWKDLAQVEEVARLTPEPAAFAYEYAVEHEDGSVSGEYWFCWPHEIDSVIEQVNSSEENVLGDPSFVPLFVIPKELVGAPISFPGIDDDEISFE
jgi:hypothetical protein